MSITIKQALQRIAAEVPSSRVAILTVLRKHADCGCGDKMIAGELDEMFAGRAYTTPKGPDGAENKKDFGTAPSMGGPGKWKGDKKNKCFYETGDEADRCYVTTNGGPSGQKKPDTGAAGADGSAKRQEYNERYKKERWKSADERLAGLRAAKVKSKWDSMRMMNDLREKHGGGSKAYYQAVIKGVESGVLAPAAVVGGGYKNGKKVAIKWLKDQMAKAK